MFPNERRVALTPQNAALLLKKGFGQVLVEKSAGLEAQFLDEQYRAAGAILVDKTELFERSDILLKVRPPVYGQEAELVKEGRTLISFLYPNQNKPIVEALAARKANAFAMEMIPRISRAQVFDALRFVAKACTPRLTMSHATASDTVPWPTSQGTRRFLKLPIISVVISLVRLLQLGMLSSSGSSRACADSQFDLQEGNTRSAVKCL